MNKQKNETEIDFVIPWVDGSDPEWRAEKDKYTKTNDASPSNAVWYGEDYDDREVRFRDWGLMRYWFRGVEKFAPWVRKVHFLTWGHVPTWLNTEHPKLCIVNHKDFIPEKYLPTFNSDTIDMNIHRVPDLSERFVYFNDDMFLIKPTAPEQFFKNGLPRGAAVHSPFRTTYGSWFMIEEVNTTVLNKYFSPHKCIRENPLKWFNPIYGTYLMRTVFMLPYPGFYGMYEDHLPHSFLKETFEKIWELEPEMLDVTCSHKIRQSIEVNQWLCEWWQYMEGNFIPREIKFGRNFSLGDSRADRGAYDAVSYIENQRGHLVCINDVEDDGSIDEIRNLVADAFEKILPEKSEFEKTVESENSLGLSEKVKTARAHGKPDTEIGDDIMKQIEVKASQKSNRGGHSLGLVESYSSDINLYAVSCSAEAA